ncbi:MAG: molybdopterin-dependent oxidoreductase [Deltaproteobacteria bacterium]|nr:molybdopterin-dependent oxidoreductase [Deltaproteobacteria bacterium]
MSEVQQVDRKLSPAKGFWLRNREVLKKDFSIIGKPVPRIESGVKVTGAARYSADIKFPGMLYGKILRSPHAHAKIISIDTSKAEKLPGVKAVVTGKDTLGVRYGLWRLREETMDEQGLATDKVRYVGDEVAAVAAIDEDTAIEALDLIDVEYEVLPALLTTDDAIKDGAPEIHEGIKNNISVNRRIEVGNVDTAWDECDFIREDTFSTQVVQHVPMEPCGSVAKFDPSGKLTIWTTTQSAYFVQCLLAMALGMKEGDVRVIRTFTGGGFGCKLELMGDQFCSALLSKVTGKPVRIIYTRKETFINSRQKTAMVMDVKTGVKKDGKIVAVEISTTLDGGAHHSYNVVTTMITGILGTLPYRIPNYKYNGRHVYTNLPVTGAMRGHGAMQPVFAIDSQMDLIAKEIGVDPAEMRIMNATQPGDVKIPNICHVSSCGLSEAIAGSAERMNWKENYGKLPDGHGLGIGSYGFFCGALYNYFNTKRPYAEAWVRLNQDGTVHIFTLLGEIGQGTDTVMSMIVAEVLGVKMEDVTIKSDDTGIVTGDTGAFSSRTTMMAGNACKAAAEDVRDKIFEVVGAKLELKVQDALEIRDGKVFIQRTDESVTIAEAAMLYQNANKGAPVLGRGVFTPSSHLNEGTVVSPTWSFGSQVLEVKVDKETGQVTVINSATAHDCGIALNPLAVEGQLEGSIHMALGYALTEECKFNDKGEMLNPNFQDYKILSALDMPPVESIVVETDDIHGPFGGKEAGEGLTIPTAPAIANAIYDAVGVSIKSLPITPEKILRALKEKEEKEKAGK